MCSLFQKETIMDTGADPLPSSSKNLPDPAFWRGKRVFLTGHTGFKGGWLALWLTKLGANVHGYALPPSTEPSLFSLARVNEGILHHVNDVRDLALMRKSMTYFKPDIVLHLAAQPILRWSYEIPVETYATNVMGTVHVMEVARHVPSAKVTLVITTDKCYENREDNHAFRETDAMGGHDPYSSSKACAELAVSAYGRSYFNKGDQVVATARAGNVIGGGDWAQHRLMTDIIAAIVAGQKPVIRNPAAIRPWQHVLEPLSGYMRAVEYLWQKRSDQPECWNFGPGAASEVSVAEVANDVCRLWGFADGLQLTPDARALHEAHYLRLDSTKAHKELGWQSHLDLKQALALTVDWYKAWQKGEDMREVTLRQIEDYRK
jgi:CDP-glucose 4,6-dehydratase